MNKSNTDMKREVIREISEIISAWNNKINEYIDFNYMSIIPIPIPNTYIHKFDITAIYLNIQKKDNESCELAYRLIDLKLYLSFLKSNELIHLGSYVIVGRNEIEKLTPMALCALNKIALSISIISALIERILDLVDFIESGSSKDGKKNKWPKKIDRLNGYLNLTCEEIALIDKFKNTSRNSEFHKLSSVRAMTAKNSWDHVQDEEELVISLIERITNKYLP